MRVQKLLLGAILLSLSACRVEVYDGLSQRDANEMAALLLSAGIDARRVEEKGGTFGVEVSESKFAESVQLISDSGLPRPQFRSLDDVFSGDNLVSSRSEERARLAYALSQELSRTVTEIDGVMSARVHLSAPTLDPLGRKTTESTASVALHHDASLDTDGLVPRIKSLVSHAVDDLNYDSVLVALFPVEQRVARQNAGSQQSFDTSASLADEMVWPEALSPGGSPTLASRVASSTQPQAPVRASIDPFVIAIFAGGLIVLLLAGRTLFDRPRSRRDLDDDYEDRTEAR